MPENKGVKKQGNKFIIIDRCEGKIRVPGRKPNLSASDLTPGADVSTSHHTFIITI